MASASPRPQAGLSPLFGVLPYSRRVQAGAGTRRFEHLGLPACLLVPCAPDAYASPVSASPPPGQTASSRNLPLFPLPLVLFPAARLPLHIFEQRYRRLLADCLSSDREFGIVCRSGDATEAPISRGTIGTLTHIDSVAGLPDGRSNILVHGVSRFEVVQLQDGPTPYLIAQVEPVTDHAEPAESLMAASLEVRDLIARVGSAARTVADDRTPVPEFPDDPATLSFAIAQSIDLDLSVRQSLLESRSPLGRLRQLELLLRAVAPALEERAMVHRRARSNGHGPGIES